MPFCTRITFEFLISAFVRLAPSFRFQPFNIKSTCMRKELLLLNFLLLFFLGATAQLAKPVDTVAKKTADSAKLAKNAKKVAVKPKPLPVPEFINQPNYFDIADNRLVKLESNTAKMNSKKKTLGLGGGKQFFTMDGGSSKIRFTSSKSVEFMLKTNGDEIDLTSYIKLYRFAVNADKREVVVTSSGGILNSKAEDKSSTVNLSVKKVSPGIYLVTFNNPLEAGEYGFVWMNNMTLQEFPVYAFGIDWKRAD